MESVRQVSLQTLRERIRALEEGGAAAREIASHDPDVRPTGWRDVDVALQGGLSWGLHEWIGVEPAGECESDRPPRRAGRHWTPPLCILVHLAWQVVHQASAHPWVMWVGRTCHPYPSVLLRGRDGDRALLDHSLFVAPRDAAARLWAIDLSLRSPAVGTVIADGSGFDRAATQRLQMLARDQEKWALIARPPPERVKLSAAQSRWRVRSELSSGDPRAGVQPRWSIELLRCKGLRPTHGRRTWLLEWNGDTGVVDLSARLADLAGAPPRALPRRTRTA